MANTPPLPRTRSESPNWSVHRSQKSTSSSASARSSPKPRHPLHERTPSHQNERGASNHTIRLIQDDDDRESIATASPESKTVYAKSPFPTHPSHVFSPRTRSHGFTVAEDQGQMVSAGNQTWQPTRSSVSETLDTGRNSRDHSSQSSQPSQPAIHPSTSTRLSSDADTLLDSSLTSLSPSSRSRFSQGSSFTSASPNLRKDDRSSFGSAARTTSDSSETRRNSGIRAVPSSSAAVFSRPPPETVSEESLVSSASSETFSDRKHTDRATSEPLTPSPAPRPSQPREPQPSSTDSESGASLKPVSSTASVDDTVIRVSPSLESLAFAVIGRDFADNSSDAGSANPHAVQAAIRSGARIQYPVVRPPSTSSSFAESSSPPSSRRQNQPFLQPARMTDPLERRRWSAQLSTIPSESERVSQALTTGSGSGRARRRTTIGSIASSVLEVPPSQSGSSISYPAPLFSPSRSPVSPISPVSPRRESDEHEDTLSELHPGGLFPQRPFLSRSLSEPSSRPSSATSESSSYSSFVANTIPAWARFYYRRGERVSMAAPSLRSQPSDSQLNPARSERSDSPLDGHFPYSIFRPRNRPRLGQQTLQPPSESQQDVSALPPTPGEQPEMQQTPRRPERLHLPPRTGTTEASNTDSMQISETPSGEGAFVAGTPPRTRRHISMAGMFSPHLQRDRRSAARLSAWTVPSIEENFVFGDGGPKQAVSSRGNRQVILFILGFVFPFAWMIAAILPLPKRTNYAKHVTPSQLDVELQIHRSIAPMEERRYLKARWWRNLNRIMSVVGLIVIILVVSFSSRSMTRTTY
jgi:hypothetical protein